MATLGYVKDHVKVADELFLILALLHRENPQQEGFTVGEMLERAKAEGLGSEPKSLRAHASGHAAANRPPGKNGKYRMVFVEADGRIRLLRPSDYVHPDRHQKIYPEQSDIPERYHDLLEWAKLRMATGGEVRGRWLEGLFELRGMGKEVWRGVDPDEYVRKLREDWE